MDKAALVSVDLATGSEILKILDQAKVKVSVALWAVLPEYEDWRLVLAARQFDALGVTDAFGLINESLDAAKFPVARVPVIVILPMTDPFIKHLRRVFAKAKSVQGMRLGFQTIGNRFIEDAFVYRIK